MLERLIPLILKVKDSESSPDILDEYIGVIESEYNTMRDLIEDLSQLVSPKNTDYKKYLLHLVYGQGLDYIDVNNWIVENIVYLHKIKGTNQSWQQYWHWLTGTSGFEVIELYKTTRYETQHWGYPKSNEYPLKSCKIQICYSYCETYAETEDIDEAAYFEMVEDVAPVNVRLRPNVTSSSVDDTVDQDYYDTLGCPVCETGCQVGCETAAEVWIGSSIDGEFEDAFAVTNDTFKATSRCVSVCETSCEDCCETSCECDACELFCETGCETQQTHGPGGGEGACASECMSTCETMCQFTCELACQCACTSDGCEAYCIFGNCQGSLV